jgi:hypothetical protein
MQAIPVRPQQEPATQVQCRINEATTVPKFIKIKSGNRIDEIKLLTVAQHNKMCVHPSKSG